MPTPKTFKLRKEDIKPLVAPMGGCFATDHITVEGMPVGFMYREVPDHELDSGWRFFSGRETQEYVDDAANTSVFDVNTIANCDPAVVPYLQSDTGTQWERVPGGTTFRLVDE